MENFYPDDEEFGEIKWLKYWLCEVLAPRHTPILRQTMSISMSENNKDDVESDDMTLEPH